MMAPGGRPIMGMLMATDTPGGVNMGVEGGIMGEGGGVIFFWAGLSPTIIRSGDVEGGMPLLAVEL
jgi:hypothetical protein